MKTLTSALDVERLASLIELVDQAMILIDVLNEREFVYRKLNASFGAQTGMEPAVYEGRKPHDVLPQRVADAIVGSFARGVAARRTIVYEEVLELETGTRWWHTALTPIQSLTGEVRLLLATSVDITETKQREFALSDQLARARRINTDLGVLNHALAHELRRPVAAAVALIQIAETEATGLLPEGVEALQLAGQATERAVRMIDRAGARSLHIVGGAESAREIDLGTVCAGALALADPDGRLQAELPERCVLGEAAPFQLAVHRLVRATATKARQRVQVTCAEAAEGVVLSIADDGGLAHSGWRETGQPVLPDDQTAPPDEEIEAAIALVESRGGEVVRTTPPPGLTVAIAVRWPGYRLGPLAPPATMASLPARLAAPVPAAAPPVGSP